LDGVIDFITNYVRMIKITDVLDMLLVAFIVYKLITFMSKSASARVIRGVIVLLAAMWLSSILELNVVNYLLGNAMEFGVLVLVILFQPELRRFLERVGSSEFMNIFGRAGVTREMETAINQTISACVDLSKTKTGALIIFERRTKLDDTIKTGTLINADMQAELIKNIFYPKTPLHDGAVIVRNGKIAAAGCILPNSSNPNISKELGTRHRAGIGMSEVSDAIVIIVSEETGSISIAIDGMLKRHLAPDTFEKILKNELMPDTSENTGKINSIKSFRQKVRGKIYDKENDK
jgi:diadenylate cyclase